MIDLEIKKIIMECTEKTRKTIEKYKNQIEKYREGL
jgi:ATP-dependent Zn protease